MTNDYYDFNPSATTWVLMLTGVVLFVVALTALFIVLITRSEATGPVRAISEVPPGGELSGDAADTPPSATV
jgi:hypothetical protein